MPCQIVFLYFFLVLIMLSKIGLLMYGFYQLGTCFQNYPTLASRFHWT